MADAGKCFATESVSPDAGQVFESFQLGRGKSLAENGQVIFVDPTAIIGDLK